MLDQLLWLSMYLHFIVLSYNSHYTTVPCNKGVLPMYCFITINVLSVYCQSSCLKINPDTVLVLTYFVLQCSRAVLVLECIPPALFCLLSCTVPVPVLPCISYILSAFWPSSALYWLCTVYVHNAPVLSCIPLSFSRTANIFGELLYCLCTVQLLFLYLVEHRDILAQIALLVTHQAHLLRFRAQERNL